MDKMLNPQSRRMRMSRPRPRTVLIFALATITAWYLLFSGPAPQLHVVPYLHEHVKAQPEPPVTPPKSTKPPAQELVSGEHEQEKGKEPWDIDIAELRGWKDEGDEEDPDDVEPGYETDGKEREAGDISRLQKEKDMRKMWRYAYKVTADLETSNLIYGNTLDTLESQDNRTAELEAQLRQDPHVEVDFTDEKPVRFNPYPDYNSNEWKKQEYAPYVPCKGATGELIEDILVFKGRPSEMPDPKIGSFSVMNMDANICWERETRLGPYGLLQQTKKVGGVSKPIQWDNVNWGDLQRRCVHSNAKRYNLDQSRKNPYLNAYPETTKPDEQAKSKTSSDDSAESDLEERSSSDHEYRATSDFKKEKRTAVLLRSYTGKTYTENDKQTIRAMVNEVSLKSGGEYEVFLLVHVKDHALRIFDDPETYQAVLRDNIPTEFHGMTVLWNDEVVWNIYTEMKEDDERSVHSAQWLSVQKFSHDHPQFDYIWNWEMDFRYTGQHYDLLDKMNSFARKQPRRGLWERNERWYIPSYHGDYDTTFRKEIEGIYGNNTVWGPVDLPFINPVGPKPPTKTPEEDDYIWGVGEDADVITVGPMFNPINSNWIIGKHVWGYNDENHNSTDVPRRTTIVTHSRVSKRLLDIMHVENMRGNHVASEMTPQTVALHHGFKAVFAPHPVFMDRDWDGGFVNHWFNPGDLGQSGGYGSPMGWGRERRYQGNTWYYRAEPPNRLYNNWMGWIDTGIGGERWEQKHGRPCLPSIMLHPIKDSEPTDKDHKTGFSLIYG